MKWLIRKLVDNGWGRLGMSFRWLFGNDYVLTALVNNKDLKKIEHRYDVLRQTGFFSGEKEVAHNQDFIRALFAYDAYESDAFSKSLAFAHAWNENSVKPFSLFLDFIRRIFFQGPSANIYKQTFIESVFHQHKGESNALSRTAWVKNPTNQAESNPLQILHNALTDADCFTGEFAAKNRPLFFKAVFAFNKKGENALHRALQSRPMLEQSCPNFTLLLKELESIDYSSEANSKICIDGVLHVGEYGGVLAQAIYTPSALQQIVALLKKAGCFANEQYKKAFISAICTPDSLGRNALLSAVNIPESLEIINECLHDAGCFASSEHKQQLINAMFAQDADGCNAVSESFNCSQTLNLLHKAGCFDAPIGNPNHQAFIDTVLKPTAGNPRKSFLRPGVQTNLIPLIEHLTMAGCFSGSGNTPNKRAFVNAILADEVDKSCILSTQHILDADRAKEFTLLLEKLIEAGCFDETHSRKQFIAAVRRNNNQVIFRSLFDLKSYLTLHKCLVKAGCSPQDIAELLNEPVDRKYNIFKPTTPLINAMIRFGQKDELLIARLKHDGAKLTDLQEQQVKDYLQQSSQLGPVADKVPYEQTIAKIKKELTKPIRPSTSQHARKASWPNLLPQFSLFASTPSKHEQRSVDDISVGPEGKNITPR